MLKDVRAGSVALHELWRATFPDCATCSGSINLFVRRSTPALVKEGLPVEGLGVRADIGYRMTMNDVLVDNVDLIGFAACWLTTASKSWALEPV